MTSEDFFQDVNCLDLSPIFSRGCIIQGGPEEGSCPSPVDSFITFNFFKKEGFPTIDDDDFDFDYVRKRETRESQDLNAPGMTAQDPAKIAQEKNMYDSCAKKLRDSRKKRKSRKSKQSAPSPMIEPQDSSHKTNLQLKQATKPLRSNIKVLYTTSGELDVPDTLQNRTRVEVDRPDARPGPSQGDERRQLNGTMKRPQTRRGLVVSEGVQDQFNLESILAEPLYNLNLGSGFQPSFHIPTREDTIHSAGTTECINVIKRDLADRGIRANTLIIGQTLEKPCVTRPCCEENRKRQLNRDENLTEIPSPYHRQYCACSQDTMSEAPPCTCEEILCKETPCKYHDDMARAILAKYRITDLKLQERPRAPEETENV